MRNEILLDCPNPEGIGGTHRLHLHRWGVHDVPSALICVHGLTRNGRDFDFLAQALMEDYKIFCPDMPGRGKSEHLKDPQHYNYVTYVTDMLHVMETQRLFGVDWVGTSMGGIIGMMIAANVPGAIRRLVINDIGPFLPKDGLERLGRYVGSAPLFANKAAAVSYLKDVFLPWGIREEAHFMHMLEHSIEHAEGDSYRMAYDPHIGAAFKDEKGQPKPMQDIDLWPVWEKIQCPVLVLRGEKSDILPGAVAQKMAEKPDTTLVTLPNIGHAPTLMETGQIAIVKDWLAH